MKAHGQRYHCLQWLKVGSEGLHQGFTLVELMISLAVIAIMIAVSVPAVNGYLTRQAPQYASDELYGDIQITRMRAARNNQRCRIQFNAPGLNQYTIQDIDNNGNVVPGGPFKVVDLAKFRDNITFVPSPSGADPAPFITLEFLSQGIVNGAATAPVNSNAIYLTNRDNDVFYRVRVSLAGGVDTDRWDPNANQWR